MMIDVDGFSHSIDANWISLGEKFRTARGS